MNLPKHLVFSGGGLNGVQMLKAINLIEKKVNGTLFKKLPLQQVSGVSIGSMIALAVILDYSSDEYIDEVIPKYDNFLNLFPDMKVSNMLSNYGLTSNESIIDIVDTCVSIKHNEYKDKSISFKELFDITKVQFNVYVTNLSTNESEIWNHITKPDIPISFAIQISTCIPFLFSPILYDKMYYIDGSTSNRFPVNLVTSYDDMLGFQIVKNKDKYDVSSFKDYISLVFSSLLIEQNKEITMKNTLFIKQTQDVWDMNIGYNTLLQTYQNTHINLNQLLFFQVKEIK